MSTVFSYANVLCAVGGVLDQVGVKSIAIREEEDLFVEGFDGDGQLQVQLRYDVASLYELVCQPEERNDHARNIGDEGILHRFLAEHKHDLVGALR